MPTDIILDSNTHDIDISSGTVKLFTSNIEVIGQRVKIAILTKTGEWFRDINAGLPYYDEFFINKNNKSLVDQTIIKYVSNIEDVLRVAEYSSVITNDRVLNIKMTVESFNGQIIPIIVEGANA